MVSVLHKIWKRNLGMPYECRKGFKASKTNKVLGGHGTHGEKGGLAIWLHNMSSEPAIPNQVLDLEIIMSNTLNE